MPLAIPSPPADAAPSRRGVLTGAAAATLALGLGPNGVALAASPGGIEGPIPSTPTSKPYGTSTIPGAMGHRLLRQYNYVEEEYFFAGTGHIYGPGHPVSLTGGGTVYDLRPLEKIMRRDAPFRTRLLVLKPADPKVFSGRVHMIPFHNLNANVTAEDYQLRNGDAWVGVEICSGTRFGPQEIPSGAMANLHKIDHARYGGLFLEGGRIEDWPDLQPGNLGKVFPSINFTVDDYPRRVFVQDLLRSYAQCPDIITKLAHLLKQNGPSSPLKGMAVRRIYTSGASGQSYILWPYLQYHHDNALLPDGRPPIDGYTIRVGAMPSKRPSGAVLVLIHSESEAIQNTAVGRAPMPNTDNPRFRFYEIPGVGHELTAELDAPGVRDAKMTAVLPPGIQGLSDRGGPTDYDPYTKVNAPIMWAIAHHLDRWVEGGPPMPSAPPITRDPAAPDGIARDSHGNALGGLRTPWVDVPDGQYVARISTKNPLRGGQRLFDEAQMNRLHGSRAAYVDKCRARVDAMVSEGWVLPRDSDLMKSSCR